MLIFVITFIVALAISVAALPARQSVYPDLSENRLSPNSRIYGGVKAERGQFPYQASVRWVLFGIAKHICSGSLISDQWVLTVAHCKGYSQDTYDVALGMLNQGETHADVQIIIVVEFIVHPKYEGGIAANDIALLKLEASAKLNDAVNIAYLPKGWNECADIGEVHQVSGWGLTPDWPFPPITLHWASLPRITNNECDKALVELFGDSEPLDDTMICTGQEEGEIQSICSGDSGGPLVLEKNSTLVGVVSWGITPCGFYGAPSVYTSVCSHLDFIHTYV